MSDRARRIVVAAAVAAMLLLATVGAGSVARRAADAPAISDSAVTELYVRLAARADLLVGPYSRFQWHHPGPLYFYWLVPFYEWTGERPAGLAAGALLLNLCCLALTAWVLARRASAGVAAGICAVLALYALRAAPAMTSAWNPHVPVLPLAALVVLASAVISGAHGYLPLAALLASVMAQSHVALVPVSLALGVAAAAAPAARLLSARSRANAAVLVAVTAVTLVVVWLPSLVEQLRTPTGNLTMLWSYFAGGNRSHPPIAAAVSAWSDSFVGLLRPDFSVAAGAPYVESPVRWAELLSGLELLLLAVVALQGLRRRRRYDATLAATTVATALLALWSITRGDDVLFDHTVFWIVAVGAIAAGILLGTALEQAGAWMGPPPLRARPFAPAACALAIVLAAAAGGRQLREVACSPPSPAAETAGRIGDELAELFAREHLDRPLLRIDQDAWEIAAGAILRLHKHGRLVAVEDDWLPMFSPRFRATGTEAAVVTIAARQEHVRMLGTSGDEVVAVHDPFYVHLTKVPAAVDPASAPR